MKCKKKYMIICRLVDCEEDFGLFPLLKDMKKGDGDIAVFDRIADARKAMWADCKSFEEPYDVVWSADKKNHCKKTIRDDGREISISVPIYDGENERESWIHAKWKIVEL